jgi:hypothetical protein
MWGMESMESWILTPDTELQVAQTQEVSKHFMNNQARMKKQINPFIPRNYNET